jgi:hypothetical protein
MVIANATVDVSAGMLVDGIAYNGPLLVEFSQTLYFVHGFVWPRKGFLDSFRMTALSFTGAVSSNPIPHKTYLVMLVKELGE